MAHLYDAGPNAHGVGINEEQLHVASGIRNSSVNVLVERALDGIVSSVNTPIGTVTGAASAGFGVGLRAANSTWNPVMATPQTPLLSIFAVSPDGAFPSTVKFRIRMVGVDQFGSHIVETSPWIEKIQTNTSQMIMVVMSKVFAIVDDCFIQTDNIISTGGFSQVAIGWGGVMDPSGLEASAVTDNPIFAIWAIQGGTATNTDFVGSAPNWGIGTPMRVGPYGPDIPFPTPEYLGGTIQLVREINTPALLNAIEVVPGRLQAIEGVIPVTGFGVGRSAASWQGTPHKIGFFSNDAWLTLLNSTNGTATGTGPIALTDAGASFPTPNGLAGFMIRAGSSFATVTSNIATIVTVPAWIGGTPAGTEDYSISPIHLTGTSSENGGVPVALGFAQTLEDTIQINVSLRTTLGTQRGNNATSGYPT